MPQKANAHEKKPASEGAPGPDQETVRMLLRLLVGGVLEGSDELLRRLQERQQAIEQHPVTSAPRVISQDEADIERLRYALIGLLFETPGAINRGLARAVENTERAGNTVSRLAGPVTRSRLFRPVRRRYQRLVTRREATLNRLVELGRLEAQRGRVLARGTVTETVDEVLEYLADSPEIRDLVQQQGVSLTTEVVDELRRRVAAADRLLDSVLRRGGPGSPPAVVDLPAGNARQLQAEAGEE
jgi:hypothetical protein